MRIGGMFPLEKIRDDSSNFIEDNFPGDVKFLLSGRCAIYYCLLDIPSNIKKTAYLPAYNCETVIGSYEKAGWHCCFYDVNRSNLSPIYDEKLLDDIGVINISGYYGFHHKNDEFLKKCKEKGIVIIQDSTFTPYSINKYADYVCGSFRKWMGIPSGGIANKKTGKFNVNLKETDEIHLNGRFLAMEYREKAIETKDSTYNDLASDTFWKTELPFRKTFDNFAGDELSRKILSSFDFVSMKKIRKNNYRTIILNLKSNVNFHPVFNIELKNEDCPSHFSIYVSNRDELKEYLLNKGIASTTYWPIPPILNDEIQNYPESHYIYNHILSIQLDQRYNEQDMKYLAECLNSYKKN